MDNKLEKELYELVTEACKHCAGSPQRQKCLTKIIRLVSNKLWKENTPYYQDALQQTWVYFCQNVCEGKTANPYDPTRSSIITWLNVYLKRRLQDFYIESQEKQSKTLSSPNLPFGSAETPEMLDPTLNIEAKPDIPPLLDDIRKWAETDDRGELRKLYIEGHPEVTAQTLILRRLPPETSWQTLSAELGLPVSTLSSFYQRKCMPRLRKFGESEGYL